MARQGTTTGPTVSVQALTVVFGSVTALADVDADIAPGALTAVTGPSGAGKSTLLGALAGARADRDVTGGDVLVDGEPPRPATATRGVVLLPQGNGLASVLTASENCLIPLLDRGVAPAEARQRVGEALDAVGLGESAGHLTEELSGGQQQRVAVARAIACRPTLLLADEPTSELDHANRERVLDLLRGLTASGTTVVMATHDPEAAEAADHEIALDGGHVVGRR